FSLAGTTAIILFYGIYQMTRGPELYKGDRLEERACRLCLPAPKAFGAQAGQGSAKGLPVRERTQTGCDACGYDGKVNVIIPSYNHQTTIYGEVFEQAVRYPSGEETENYDDAPAFRPGAALQEATAGAIGDAQVVFTSYAGKRVELTTPFTGKFTLKLPAGTYKMTVEKPGFQRYEKDVEVPLATAELWQEEIPEVIAEAVLGEDAATQNPGVPDVLSIEIGMSR
ncbi:MAG: carboxypeptidase-like regulatory domain-containing protein, partial [Planctomycetota bacterium]